MPNLFIIPTTREEILSSIEEHAALHTATGWRLAAELAAIVRLADGPGGDQRSTIAKNRNGLTPTDIAARGYRGLTNHETVTRYVKGWLAEHDGIYPDPGDEVEIPEGPFPPKAANLGSRTTRNNIGEKIAAEPELAEAAAEALADGAIKNVSKETQRKLRHAAYDEMEVEPDTRFTDRGKTREQLSADKFWAKFRGAINVLMEGIQRIENGEEAPADVQFCLQIIRPDGDWNEALDDLLAGRG